MQILSPRVVGGRLVWGLEIQQKSEAVLSMKDFSSVAPFVPTPLQCFLNIWDQGYSSPGRKFESHFLYFIQQWTHHEAQGIMLANFLMSTT